MSENIVIFNNPEFGSIRTVEQDGEPWFIGKDVAEALGYANARDAIAAHVDASDKHVIQRSDFPTLEIPNRGLTIINESGLYSLILSSKLPTAKQFKRWVTSEVLPSIRKSGGYIAGQESMTDEELMAKALLVAQKQIEERDKRIASLSTSNSNLVSANIALAEEANTWDDRTVVCALVRCYANARLNGNFQYAWNTYYKSLNCKEGINLKIRRGKCKNKCAKNQPLLDFLRENEWEKAMKVAAAMCERAHINVGKVINEVNMKRMEAV